MWDEELQICVLPEVTVEGSILEEEAGLNEEIIEEPQQYQQENELEEVEYVDPNLPSSYQYADDYSEDSPVEYGQQCQVCVHFESWASKKCNKWDAIVKPSFWCDSFKDRLPWWNIPGKFYKGMGQDKEYSVAEDLAKQDALKDIRYDLSKLTPDHRSLNITFGDSFQYQSPIRQDDGKLAVFMSYEVKSIS